MYPDTLTTNLQNEANTMVNHIENGHPDASIHLARLIEADEGGALLPFAEAVAARLQDHLGRWAELGETDPCVVLEDDMYQLLKTASIDWDGKHHKGRPGEEA